MKKPFILLAGIVLFALGQAFSQETYSSIKIVAEQGLSVFMNGQYEGTTTADAGGLVLDSLSKGKYDVKVVKKGFQPVEKTFVLKKGETREFRIRKFVPVVEILQTGDETDAFLVSGSGSIRIESIPVAISINIPDLDIYSTKTDTIWEARNIVAGSYSATFSGKGKPINYTIVVSDHSLTSLLVDLMEGKVRDKSQADDKNAPAPVEKGTFKDERDHRTYPWVKIGRQVWMAMDLNYKQKTGAWCYGDDAANCAVYGMLYDWQTAMVSCPEGWHLPSDKEWDELMNSLGGEPVAGGKLKVTGTDKWKLPNTAATNEAGFNALPGGTRDSEGKFSNLGEYSYYWTSTDYGDSYSWYRVLGASSSQVRRSGGVKTDGRSVRCVKD